MPGLHRQGWGHAGGSGQEGGRGAQVSQAMVEGGGRGVGAERGVRGVGAEGAMQVRKSGWGGDYIRLLYRPE